MMLLAPLSPSWGEGLGVRAIFTGDSILVYWKHGGVSFRAELAPSLSEEPAQSRNLCLAAWTKALPKIPRLRQRRAAALAPLGMTPAVPLECAKGALLSLRVLMVNLSRRLVKWPD